MADADPYLVATDMDGTVIPARDAPDDGGISELVDVLASRPGIVLAYVTGRHYESALGAMEQYGLPRPRALVCDVGTSVFFREGDVFEPDPDYRGMMDDSLGGGAIEDLDEALGALPGVRLQEPESQSEFKLSYYVEPADTQEAFRRAEEVVRKMEAFVTLVTSVDPITGLGLLDVLPAGVAKDTALEYLHAWSGLPRARVLYAGDSGNDRAALLSGFQAVLVGNADPRLKALVRREAEGAGIDHLVYQANASYARGVVEGGRHFGVW